MDYTASALTTIADCDNVLASASKEKDALVYKKITENHELESFSQNTEEVNGELAIKQSELDNVNLTLPTLTEGTYKQSQVIRQKTLELAVMRLENRKQTSGGVALLNKQLDIARLDAEIAEIDLFIAAVEARKAEL